MLDYAKAHAVHEFRVVLVSLVKNRSIKKALKFSKGISRSALAARLKQEAR